MWAIPGCVVPMYSVALQHLGFSSQIIALCSSTQAAASVVTSLIAGQIADRWVAAEKALAVCGLLVGVNLWFLAQTTDPTWMFVLTLTFWMLCGPITHLGTAVCFAHLPLPTKQFGPVRMWGTIAWIAVGWLSGLWLKVRGTPPADVFQMGGLIAWLLAAYSFTLPSTPPRPGRGFAPLAALTLFRQRDFVVYTICLFGSALTFPFTTQLTPLLLTGLGITKEWLPATLTVAQPLEVIGLFVLPGILSNLGTRRTMMIGLSAWLLAMIILSIGRPLALIVPSLLLNGLFITCFTITGQVYVNSLAEGDLKASVQGLFNVVNGSGFLLGSLLAGQLRAATQDNIPMVFIAAVGITMSILLVFVFGFERNKTTATAA